VIVESKGCLDSPDFMGLAISKGSAVFLSRNYGRDFSRFLNENDDSIQKSDQSEQAGSENA
jgi:hypothetical protein